MKITEVRIKLMDEPGERLKAFCSITFDNCFVVRDLKIIEGTSGPFVAMPSRKLTSHCPRCGMKNHLRANHCNQCGSRLSENRLIKDADGRAKLYADIAHPINSSCREMIQEHVVAEYYDELELAKDPNYVSRYDDFDGGDYTPDPPKSNDAPSETQSETKSSSSGEAVAKPIRRYEGPHSIEETSHPHQPRSTPAAETPPAGPAENPPPERPSGGESNHHSGHETGGPHTPPNHKSQPSPEQPSRSAKREEGPSTGGGFGAGIFE